MMTTLSQIQSSLKAYTSTTPIKIIHSIPHPHPPHHPISTLLILDSSFNPPTRAHAYLLQQAITRLQSQPKPVAAHPNGSPSSSSSSRVTTGAATGRILLLLSTKNADKPSAPASTEHRLSMMALFAQDLWDDGSLVSSASTSTADDAATAGTSITDSITTAAGVTTYISGIDIALATQPRFLEKSLFLSTPSDENPYSASLGDSFVQWHILGFDTLVRLVDGKYYDGGDLSGLAPLFDGGNRVWIVRRGGDEKKQAEFVGRLSLSRAKGGFDGLGWNVEWGSKVELVDGFDGVRDREGQVVSVSSTEVRAAVRDGREEVVEQMCAEAVAEYVVANGLYREE